MSAADKLAQVLTEHRICWNKAFGQYECTSDDASYESHEHCDAEAEHASHAAAAVLAHLTAEGWAQGEAAPPEIRYTTLTDGKTELDEVVARNASVHLEAMADNAWWLSVESGGQMVHVNFGTKRAKITGTAEEV